MDSLKKTKQVVFDFLTFVFIGTFIGIVMSLVSNAFVIGVSYISNKRLQFDLFVFDFFGRVFNIPFDFFIVAAFCYFD